VTFGAHGSITVLSWFQAVSSRALDDTDTDLFYVISSSTSANTGTLYRAVSSGLKNYRNMCLTLGAKVDSGVASGAGEQRDM